MRKRFFVETVDVNQLDVLAAMEKVLNEKRELPKTSPYGDGNAAEKIVEILMCEALS